jgi:hypothetical protein
MIVPFDWTLPKKALRVSRRKALCPHGFPPSCLSANLLFSTLGRLGKVDLDMRTKDFRMQT